MSRGVVLITGASAGLGDETAALDVTDADAVPAVFDRFAEAFGPRP